MLFIEIMTYRCLSPMSLMFLGYCVKYVPDYSEGFVVIADIYLSSVICGTSGSSSNFLQ